MFVRLFRVNLSIMELLSCHLSSGNNFAKKLILFLSCLLYLLNLHTVYAQSQTGSISGVVKNKEGWRSLVYTYSYKVPPMAISPRLVEE
jgi:hypothetical protein